MKTAQQKLQEYPPNIRNIARIIAGIIRREERKEWEERKKNQAGTNSEKPDSR